MLLVATGVSHKTAPVELRERAAQVSGNVAATLCRFLDVEGVDEVALLSTCGRTEIYAVVARPGARDRLFAEWAACGGLNPETLRRIGYAHEGGEAVRHLFRVASGLDSFILGETQVVAQVKEAYRIAQQVGSVGKVLHQLFSQALACAKRVHRETALSQNAVSVSSAAAELAGKVFGRLEGKTGLLLGAGATAQLVARHLSEHGLGRLLVANRTAERAEALARLCGGEAVAWEERGKWLGHADLVLSATASPTYVLTRGMVERALQTRRNRPLLLIDMAVPRDVEPLPRLPENLFLYDIDDLEAIVAANQDERRREAAAAERIVTEATLAFREWLSAREAVPLIRSLRQRAEAIRQDELGRAFNRLPGLDEREREVIASAVGRIVNKLLDVPMVRLKEVAQGEDAEIYLRAFSLLFSLPGGSGTAARRSGIAAEESRVGPFNWGALELLPPVRAGREKEAGHSL